MKSFTLLVNFRSLLSLLFVLLASASFAQAPKTLSYQGKLSDGSGPLNGTYNLTFAIYDAASGGTILWTETSSGVAVTGGNVSLTLGKITPINVQTDRPMWMGIKVNSNPEISPRVELAGSLYSLGIGLPYSATSNRPTSLFSITATADGARAGEFTHQGTNSGQAALFATSTGGNLAFQGMNSGANEGAASLFTTNSSNPTPTLRVYNSGSGSAVALNATNSANSSPVLSINNSGTGNAITANRPIQATRFIGDGSLLTNLPSAGISLPYSSTTNVGSPAFSITNTSGTAGAGLFFSSSASTATLETQSTANSALNAVHTGASGQAANFNIQNSTNGGNAIFATSQGIGSVGYFRGQNSVNTAPTVLSENWGLGAGARINLTLAANTSAALEINHAGTGNAITANRPIQATKFIGDGSLLTNLPSGFSLPYNSVQNSSSSLFSLRNNGSGPTAEFRGNSTTNSTLWAESSGANALAVFNTGNSPNGSAGVFYVTNPSNSGNAIYASSQGTGSVGYFISDTGSGSAGDFRIASSANSSDVVKAATSGLGSAGNFSIFSAANTSPVLNINHSGTGNAINANAPIQATKFIGDGSLLTNLPGTGLTFPYSAAANTTTPTFSLTNSGQGSTAVFFGSSASAHAVEAQSTGGGAFGAINTGSNGTAGEFIIQNASSTGRAIYTLSAGTGINTYLQNQNASNTSPVLQIDNAGTGNSITANGKIQAAGLSINNNGTTIGAASFSNGNASNANPSISAITAGTGIGGYFNISNSANSSDAIASYTSGLGRAGTFSINYSSNANAAIGGFTQGVGSAAELQILNAASTAPVVKIIHAGTGNAITANRPIQATQFIGDGSLLTNLPSNGSGWGLTGTAGTVDGTNFIGTTDNVALNFRVNNQKAGRIDISNAFFGYRAGNSNIGAGNTASGSYTLQNNTSGNNNTASGSSALLSNTAGSSNTAVGSSALSQNTTGNQNTAIGQSALQTNSTGIENTATGAFALSSNTIGSDNTAIGHSSLQLNTTGSNNTATGYFSLRNNTTGYSNAANGQSSLQNNTIGSNNAAFGNNSLQNNISGSQNTATGVSALFSNTTGIYNSAGGFFALLLNTTGQQNTAIGSFALQNNTTGNQNTALGYNSFLNGASFSNSTAIGYNAQVTASNMIRLGDASVTVIQGQVAFTAASDQRLKKDIQGLDSGLDFILNLKPVSYKMKSDENKKTNWGFIAQDIEKLIGTENAILTIGGDADRTLGLRYTDFVAPLVKAVQEQQKVIEDLKLQNSQKDQKVQQMEASIGDLKATVSELSSLKAELEKIKNALGMEATNTNKKVNTNNK